MPLTTSKRKSVATMEATKQTSPLLKLPAELIQYVLSYLAPIHLAKVAQTCQALSDQSADDAIWHPLVNGNLKTPISSPHPCNTYRELYIAHHPHWFLPRHQLWFADTVPAGKLIVSRFDPAEGSIVAYAVVAKQAVRTLRRWERDPRVIIHSFDPRVALNLERPVLRLTVDSVKTEDQPDNNPSDRGYGPSSRYSKEVVMETFTEPGFYSSFMLCRPLPDTAISEGTQVWPPLHFPAGSRTRNSSVSSYQSTGYRPSALSEVSEHNFRLRKWVEYNGRRSSPRMMSFTSPNGLAAALGLNGRFFSATMEGGGGGLSVRMPEDITTYATLPQSCYTPTPDKPWQGIWCGDYSGHGCEFILIRQPDEEEQRPLPEGMDYLDNYFRGTLNRASAQTVDGDSDVDEPNHAPVVTGLVRIDVQRDALDRQIEESGMDADAFVAAMRSSGQHPPQPTAVLAESSRRVGADLPNAPSGRLEAIKLTGDINIPRGEYTFIAPNIGNGGFVRIADEELFRGARVVRSAGHIAAQAFQDGEFSRKTDFVTRADMSRPVRSITADYDIARYASTVLGRYGSHLLLSAR